MQQTDNKTDRWLAVGLLLLVIGIVIISVIPVIALGLEYHEKKGKLLSSLQRYQQTVAQKDRVAESLNALRQQHQQRDYFYVREKASLASADLQKFIKSTIVKADGQQTSSNSSTKASEDNFTRIEVKVRMMVTMEQMREIFHRIESATPLMMIEELDIKPIRSKRNPRTRQMESSDKLTVNFQVTSFMKAQQL